MPAYPHVKENLLLAVRVFSQNLVRIVYCDKVFGLVLIPYLVTVVVVCSEKPSVRSHDMAKKLTQVVEKMVSDGSTNPPHTKVLDGIAGTSTGT